MRGATLREEATPFHSLSETFDRIVVLFYASPNRRTPQILLRRLLLLLPLDRPMTGIENHQSESPQKLHLDIRSLSRSECHTESLHLASLPELVDFLMLLMMGNTDCKMV
jgi:hypothetical protein